MLNLYDICINPKLNNLTELIPEFYYNPEFLKIQNNVKFGRLQNGNEVKDVILPKWANNSPQKFIQIMRDALESDYVSNNLNLWIDLIFGYKQSGLEGIKEYNIFYYLTYPKNFDFEKLSEMQQLKAKSMIEHCGQCPNQIFFKSHPKRSQVKNHFTKQIKSLKVIFSKIISKQSIIYLKYLSSGNYYYY
jgi:hypothetical protein